MQRLIVEKQEAIWIVRFHHPPQGLMDQVTAAELLLVLDEIDASESVRAVVLTGYTEGVFIRHYDVGELAVTGAALAARGIRFDTDRPVPESDVHTCLRRIEESRTPFIAAINGIAMGGGLEIALACDIRLAQSGDYDLGLPEVTVGLLPGAGGTQRMTRLLGEARALELVLLGKTISPERAFQIGLVAECVEGDVLSRAHEVATQLAKQSELATGHIKHLIKNAGQLSSDEGFARERTLFCDVMVSDQGQTAMQAMVGEGRDIRDMLKN
jgi:enoyl-CoA hydratase